MSEANAPRLLATPAGITLCALDSIADGAARNFVIQLRAGRFHGFAVRRGGRVFGYVDRCPHAGLPLALRVDAYLTQSGELIACGWHGALFHIENGACAAGPCPGQSLIAWRLLVVAGEVVTAGEGRRGS